MEHNILFRGKAINSGEWVYGVYFKHDTVKTCFATDDPKPKHYIIQDGSCDWGFEPPVEFIEVDPNTICRCTGLMDKYGKPIYEHDYVRTIFGRICEVVWFSSPQHCGWDLTPVANLNHSAPSKNSMWSPEWLIVLGNIYDNPELLRSNT